VLDARRKELKALKRSAWGKIAVLEKASGPGAAVFERAVKFLMADRNCSREEAIAEIEKAFGNEASRQTPFASPDVRRQPADEEELDRGDARVEEEEDEKDLATRIKELMNSEGLSYEAAISRLHVAEKMRKGFI
jgi:hypothetical protein